MTISNREELFDAWAAKYDASVADDGFSFIGYDEARHALRAGFHLRRRLCHLRLAQQRAEPPEKILAARVCLLKHLTGVHCGLICQSSQPSPKEFL